jgi:hypothetical protein
MKLKSQSSNAVLLVAIAAVMLLSIKPASASTLDVLFNYSIAGTLNERIDVNRMDAVDVDGNGLSDILVVTSGKAGSPYTELKNSVYVFNPNGTVRWRYAVDREILASLVKDINNDNRPETILSSGLTIENIPRGAIRIVSADGQATREFSRTSIVSTMYVDDVYDNKYYELLTGSEGKFTLLYIDGAKIWEYPLNGTLNSSVYSTSTIDLDGDKHQEMVFGAAGVYLLDGLGNLISSYELEGDLEIHHRKVFYVSHAYTTAGGVPSIIAATATNNLYALGCGKDFRFEKDANGNKKYFCNLEVKWKHEFYNTINAIKIYDIDKDKLDEVVVADEDGTLQVIDNTGSLLWSFRLDGPARDVAIGDIENDGNLDVVTQSSAGTIYDLDTGGNFRWAYYTSLHLDKLSLGDVDGDSMLEIAVTTLEPKVYLFKLNETFIQKFKADNLYAQGERYFLVSSYLTARDYLVQARDIYSRIGSESDIQRTQSLISNIDSKISEERRKLADVYYQKAQDYYISGDYKTSANYAQMAKEIYSEFGDSENVLKCELLQMRIDAALTGGTTQASTSLAVNNTGTGEGGINLNRLLLFGFILLVGVAIIIYVMKKRKARAEPPVGPPEKGMDEDILAKIDKMDLNIGGGEDEG